MLVRFNAGLLVATGSLDASLRVIELGQVLGKTIAVPGSCREVPVRAVTHNIAEHKDVMLVIYANRYCGGSINAQLLLHVAISIRRF
jgi:hypothetical protein